MFIFIYFSKPTSLTKFVYNLEDVKFSIRDISGISRKPFEDLVVVVVDEKSINRFGRWPWDRKITGELIERLKEAKVVGLDIVFSEQSSPESDKALMLAINRAGNVVSGFFFRDYATQTVTEELIDLLEDCSLPRYRVFSDKVGIPEYSYIESNIPGILERALSCAFFNIKPDVDGIYRHYPTVYIFEGMLFPSLAIQLVRFYFDREIDLELDELGVRKLTIGEITIDRNYIRLNFYRDINTVSAVDVLDGKVDPSFFKDRIVIVGITEMGIYDVRPTPIDPLTPGVFLHYTAVSNIINGDFIKESPLYDLIFTVTVMLLVFFAGSVRRLKYRLSLYIPVITLPFILPSILFIYENIWILTVYPFLFSFVYVIILEMYQFFKTDLQTRELKRAFSKYLSPDVVEQIVRNPEKLGLGGEEKEITVLFADIRDFTQITEKLTPKQVAKLLNVYFDDFTKIILNNRGLLDKYIGDAVMAVFNAPVAVPDHPDRACRTALDLVDRLDKINEKLEKLDLPPIRIGIGINTGKAIIGNLGSSLRFEYTAIGDTVNLASRLEGLNRIYGTEIILSQYTVERVRSEFLFRKLDRVRVKGKEQPVYVYQLMKKNERNENIKALYEEALSYYFNTEFNLAVEIFKELWERYQDFPSKVLLERTLNLIKNPPGVNWKGIYEVKEK
ncbi:CHASE2 domain-containing protein [Persephonella sp.]